MLTKKTIRSMGNAAGRVPLAKREAKRLVRWLCPDGDPRLVQALMHKGLSALSGEALSARGLTCSKARRMDCSREGSLGEGRRAAGEDGLEGRGA